MFGSRLQVTSAFLRPGPLWTRFIGIHQIATPANNFLYFSLSYHFQKSMLNDPPNVQASTQLDPAHEMKQREKPGTLKRLSFCWCFTDASWKRICIETFLQLWGLPRLPKIWASNSVVVKLFHFGTEFLPCNFPFIKFINKFYKIHPAIQSNNDE